LKSPENNQEMVQKVLSMATEESDNPDLRDRGYIYWRLLSSDPEAARAVILAEKPEISDDAFTLDPVLLDDLIAQISTLSSVYHKPPEAFVTKHLNLGVVGEELDEEEEGIDSSEGTESKTPSSPVPSAKPAPGGGNLLDLLDDSPAPTPSFSAPAAASNAVPKVQWRLQSKVKVYLSMVQW